MIDGTWYACLEDAHRILNKRRPQDQEIKIADIESNVTQRISKSDVFMKVISNCPMGLEQTMRITTNYLQLKTIYHQRKHHKLKDWHIFCEWIESLPKFKEYCLK